MFLSKQQLRPFIRDATTRAASFGAPWIVREDIALDFGLSMEPPADLHSRIKKRKTVRLKSLLQS
jgi:hypothetical protein